MYCIHFFIWERVLENLTQNCIVVHGAQAIRMPDEGSKIKFEKFCKQQNAPFVIYADFEAITEKTSGCQPSNETSYTQGIQRHTACSHGYKLVCCYNYQYSKPVKTYRGTDAVRKFMK